MDDRRCLRHCDRSVQRRLAAGKLEKGGPCFARNLERCGKPLGDLLGWPARAALEVVYRIDRASDALGELGLSQVKIRATSFEPCWEAGCVYHNKCRIV